MPMDLNDQQTGWFNRTDTTSATPGLLTRVTMPNWTEGARVTAHDGDLQIAHDGVDGVAIGAHYGKVFQGGTLPIYNVSGERPFVFYVTGTSATVTFSIEPLPRGR